MTDETDKIIDLDKVRKTQDSISPVWQQRLSRIPKTHPLLIDDRPHDEVKERQLGILYNSEFYTS